MPFARVANTIGVNGTIFDDNTEMVTLPVPATALNLLVLWVQSGNDVQVFASEGFGSAVKRVATGSGPVEIFFKTAVGGEQAIVVTASEMGGGGQFGRIRVTEFNPDGATVLLDNTNSATSTATTTHATGTVETTTDDGLLIVAHYITDEVTLDPAFTAEDNVGGLVFAYRVVSSAGTYQATSTTPGPADDGVSCIAAFHGADVGVIAELA